MRTSRKWAPVAAALHALGDAVASLDQDDDDGFIDQNQSALGPRLHCAAVRRRRGNGEPGALIVGRAHLLSKDAHYEELERRSIKATPPKSRIAEELERKLRLVGLDR